MDQITVVKEITFDSAHRLPDYYGPCFDLHGHRFTLRIGVRGEIGSGNRMIADFKELKVILQEIHSLLDHKYLNEVTEYGFPCYMPTAELIVLWARDLVQKRLETGEHRCSNNASLFATNLKLVMVRLYETPTSYAEWSS